jgi:hypothetical protein
MCLFLAEVVVSPPFVFLPFVKSLLRSDFHVAAQNCWVRKGGAFTGEVRYVQILFITVVLGIQFLHRIIFQMIDALMMIGVIHSRCWLEAVSVEAMEHYSHSLLVTITFAV